jgi:hypothetical protein
VLTALSDLFNDRPVPLNLDVINARLEGLLDALRARLPGFSSVEVPLPVLGEGDVLALTVPALNLDLLGLVLRTDPITVNASSTEGDGLLLGNVLSSVPSTINATPEELTRLNTTINAALAKVVGALNNVTAVLPPELLATLTGALGTLADFDLIAPAPGSTATIPDLSLVSPDGTPVTVDLLGLHVTTSDNNVAEIARQTGSTVAVVRRIVGKVDQDARRKQQEEIACRIDGEPLGWGEKVARWKSETGQSEATFWRVLKRLNGRAVCG